MGRPTIDEKGEPRKRAVFYVTEYEKRVLIDTLAEQRKPGIDPAKVYSALAYMVNDHPKEWAAAIDGQRVAKMETAPETGLGSVKAKTPRVAGSTPAPLTIKKKSWCRGPCVLKAACPPGECKNA